MSHGGIFSTEDRVELSKGIADAGQRMADLIENLLVLARLEVGNIIELSDFDAVTMLQEAANAAVGSERKVVINAPKSCFVRGEPTYFRQVVANLVGNAHKYSPPKEPIEVWIQCGATEAAVSVLDRGVGVSPEELNLIFDSFYRSAGTADFPGNGLGLAICKRFVEAMDGQISARLRPGRGLAVQFTIPTGVVPNQAAST